MAHTLEATYEDGILRLDRPLPLRDKEKVRVTIEKLSKSPHSILDIPPVNLGGMIDSSDSDNDLLNDNTPMIEQQTIPHDVLADLDALTDALDSGKDLDTELVQRVQERAERAREELHQRVGMLDVAVASVREDRDSR